ncbi:MULTISPECIES: 5-oxoprolinase subunit C family protein [Virgibacillus]|uniref:KipI antagonist n=2 Tax=Virgibacillus TaxID=84406 RepID=A0A024Q9R1_9BACI|nr:MULTISPECIES: biotin-dependent carboxyltransferase family protein [Virgibacillus]EQB37511.1 hypothetical protein M948_02900 [Virgibacillus sp. CM-4]GGJ60416.1 urea carboxylase [Virgibacillus kapii]CDQ38972.1 KipI antagonist [Virgibacillus massiliensis]
MYERIALFKVHKPGIYTTFQDLGRYGYQQFGVPVSGAMDYFALQAANIVVGNSRNTACLEVTLVGPKLEACDTITIAITGADLEAKINGREAPMYTSIQIQAGDVLTFEGHRNGVRSYIAIAGELDSPSFFGSQSVDIKSGFGTTLDNVPCIYGYPRHAPKKIGLSESVRPRYQKSIKVGVIEGPHTDHFSMEARNLFFRQTHVVETNSNRMGYRLQSKKIVTKSHTVLWSDAVPFGGIQIPPNGQPIILMADRQTTGGYPRIGTICSADLPKVAQLAPKGKISFYPISLEDAQKRQIELNNQFYQWSMFRKDL